MRADLSPDRCAVNQREEDEGVPEFDLDPKLGADSIAVAELGLCSVRLMMDANYPWLLLVPRRAGAVEIIDLDRVDQGVLMEEIALASRALKASVVCDKLNVAALGNSVRQLHVHIIARQQDDAAWPRPVWGATPARSYAPGEADALAQGLAAHMKP
jgi:diadenosine tetraphosphate (Ap4A) HIT family hydrolase